MTRSEDVHDVLDNIQHELGKQTPIIVEGKNDRKALEDLGMRGKIFTLSQRSFSELCQSIADAGAKKVIIVTDYDTKGRHYAKRLRDFFKNEAVEADLEYRKKLKMLTGFVQLEHLPSLLARIETEENKRK